MTPADVSPCKAYTLLTGLTADQEKWFKSNYPYVHAFQAYLNLFWVPWYPNCWRKPHKIEATS